MPIDFPSPATVGQQYTYGGVTYTYTAQGVWSAVSSTIATPVAPTTFLLGGQLTYVSATQLAFLPFNGNQIKINGKLYAIPNAGIAGLANTNVFVAGVAGQNLAANTQYYVYAFDNGGMVTADFRGTTLDGVGSHRPSQVAGNEGVEVRYVTASEDLSRSLIGAVITNASSQFQDTPAFRAVASWFNRRPRTLVGPSFSPGISSAFPTAYGVYNYFWSWGDAIVAGIAACQTVQNTLGQTNYIALGVDGVAGAANGQCCDTANVGYFLSSTVALMPAEGWHYLNPFIGVTAGGGTFYGTIVGTVTA